MKTTIRLSKLLFENYPKEATKLTDILNKHLINYEVLEDTKDIWARDFIPLSLDDGTLVSYIYEPDYLKDEKYVHSKTTIAFEKMHLDLVIDGGNFVRFKNKAIMTDEIFEENPTKTKDDIIKIIKLKCKLDDLIIIPQQPYDTFGHSDSMVRWIDENSVLINDFSIESKTFNDKLLKTLKAHNLTIKTMKYSNTFFVKDRNWGAYLNFIKIGNLIIVPVYGIDEDILALNQIQNIYNNCIIEPVEFNAIINEGGAIHCITSEKILIDEYLILEVLESSFKVLKFKIKDKNPFILEYKEFKKEEIDDLKDYLKNQNSYFIASFNKTFYDYQIENIINDFSKSNISFNKIVSEIFAIDFALKIKKDIKNGWLDLGDFRHIVLNGLVWYLMKEVDKREV